MPSLQRSGRIGLSAIEQVQIMVYFIPRNDYDRSMGRYSRRLPKHIREFEKKYGGEFVEYAARSKCPIRFSVTDERRFMRQLNKLRVKK